MIASYASMMWNCVAPVAMLPSRPHYDNESSAKEDEMGHRPLLSMAEA
jgi:hypothetical protein